MTREVEMKKSIIIMCLCALQAACASQPAATDSGSALLSFNDLASEITVGFRDISAEGSRDAASDENFDTP